MEGRADGEHDGAAGALELGQGGCLFDGCKCAGDYGLAGGVEVGGGYGEAGFSRGFLAGFGHQGRVQREDGGHGALTGGDGQLHGPATRFHGANGIGKIESPGSYVGGPLAQRMTLSLIHI